MAECSNLRSWALKGSSAMYKGRLSLLIGAILNRSNLGAASCDDIVRKHRVWIIVHA